MLTSDGSDDHHTTAASKVSTQQQEQQRLMERGKELLAAHQPRQALTAEDRSRLMSKGRALLDARIASRQGTLSVARHGGESGDGSGPASQANASPSTPFAAVAGEEMEQQLDAALQQHDVDTELVSVLQGELALLRKQLGVMREGQQLHTPLRSGAGAGAGGNDSDGAQFHERSGPHPTVGGVPSRNVHDEWLVAQLQDQLAHLTHQSNERDAELRTLRDRNEDLEKEALALCKTIADLQAQAKERDEQLAVYFDTIDRLESQISTMETDAEQRGLREGREQSDAAGSRLHRNDFASPTSTVSGDQMAYHVLEEQLHQLSREKLELERETEGQREIIANLQGQWNALVQEVQKRELILTEEVQSLEKQLADARRGDASSASAKEEEGYVPARQLDELRATLYAEFNNHVAQFQEVNNKHWADMVGAHQEELKAKDKEIEMWRTKHDDAIAAQQIEREHGSDATAATVPPPSSAEDEADVQRLRLELEDLRVAIARYQADLVDTQSALDETRHTNAILVAELDDSKALLFERNVEISRVVSEHQQLLLAQQQASSAAVEASTEPSSIVHSVTAEAAHDVTNLQQRITELEAALVSLQQSSTEHDTEHAAVVSDLHREHEVSMVALRAAMTAEHEAAIAAAEAAAARTLQEASKDLHAKHFAEMEELKRSTEEVIRDAVAATEERFSTPLLEHQRSIAHALSERDRLVQDLEHTQARLRDAEDDRQTLSRQIAAAHGDSATHATTAQQHALEAMLSREQRARCDAELRAADALLALLLAMHASVITAIAMPLWTQLHALQQRHAASSADNAALVLAHSEELETAKSEHAAALDHCEQRCAAQRNDAIAALRDEMAVMVADHGNDQEFYRSQLAEVERNLVNAVQTIEEQRVEMRALCQANDALQQQQQAAGANQSQVQTERIRRLEHELAAVREAAKPTQQELRNYRSVVEQLEEANAERSRAMGSLRQDVENKSIALHDARLEVEALAQELASVKSESAAALMQHRDALQERDEERKHAMQRLEHVQAELDRVVEQHSKDLLDWQETLRRNDAAAREDMQAVKEELAVANTLLSQHTTGEQLSRTAQEHVRNLQAQLTEQVRLVQQLNTRLQIANEEIAEKSSIIRDQDFSLSSLGENSDAHLTMQHHADRIEELEARIKRLIREKDAALMEKDACAVELSNTNRKIDAKDQAIKRLEAELRASKQQLQNQKSDAALKSRQLSDFRQEVAQYTSQMAMLHERVEEEVARREEVEQLLGVAAHAHTLLEEKLLVAVTLLADEIVRPVTSAWVAAVDGFSTSNANLLKRCDAIDALAQEALADGMRQNKELRNQCRAQHQRIKLLEEAYGEGERKVAELEAANAAATATAQASTEELHALRASTTATTHGLQRELAAARAATSQASAALERAEADLVSMESARAADKASWDEAMASLRVSLKERHEQLQRLQHHSDAQMEKLTADLYDKTREQHDLQRQVKGLTAQVADLMPRLEVAEPALAALEIKAAELAKTLATTVHRRESEGAAAQERIGALEASLASTKEALETAQVQQHHAQAALATQAAQLHVVQEELGRTRERLKSSDAALSEALAKCDAADDARHHEARAMEQRLAALQKANRSALTEQQDAAEALQQANAALAAVEEENKTLKISFHVVKADLADTQQNLKQSTHAAEVRVGRLEADLADTAAQLQAANALVVQLQDDKRQCLQQLSTTENLLREANAFNAATHRELKQLQEHSSAALARADNETRQLQGDLATARKAAAASDARARDAERTCQSLEEEKQRCRDEFEQVRNGLQSDLHSAMQEKQEKHNRVVDLHRQVVAHEAEIDHLRREAAEHQSQLQTLQGELAEYRTLVHSTSDRARLAVSEREELNGQVAALRDELRRQKTQTDRKIKELTEELADKQGELSHLQQRVQQGAHVMRSSEMGLQQSVTDLTVAQHQLKHELAALTTANQALEATVEQERAAARKAQSETVAVRTKLSEAEKALRTYEQLGADSNAQRDAVVQQLNQELESLRCHAAEDKRSALASLERVIQADRQALADVRQARERALRSADQAQRERAELEQEVERVTAMVRVARREAEECNQELHAMCTIADQAASELGLMEGDRSYAQSPMSSSNFAAHASASTSHSPIHRPGAPSDVGTSLGASRGGGAGSGHARRPTAAATASSFASLMDKLLLRVSASKRGSDAVAAERQQLRDVHSELDVHERAIVDASTMLQKTQHTLRQLSDRIELQRQTSGGGGTTQYFAGGGRRSGSRSDEEASRDPSNDRTTMRTTQHHLAAATASARPGSASSAASGGAASTAVVQAHHQHKVRRQRLVLSRLLQQCVLLEKCMQTSSHTQEAMMPHLQAVNEQLASIERAVSTVTYVEHSAATAAAGGASTASSSIVALHSAIPGIEGYAAVGKHVLDAAHHQRLIVGAGLCVIATRLAQQTRMLVSLHQQLDAWHVAAQQMPIDVLLQAPDDDTSAPGSGGASRGGSGGAGQSVTHPLVSNPREFAHIFSQGESFATLSFLAIASMSPVVVATGTQMPQPAVVPSKGAASSSGARAQSGHRRNVLLDGDDDEEVVVPQADDDDTYRPGGQDDGGADAIDSDDANNAGDGGGGAGTRTRAFQKMRKENKRLYTLVRNLTEKLKVASVQASSTTSAPGGGVTAPSGRSASAGTVAQPSASSRHGPFGAPGPRQHVDPHDVSPIRRVGTDDDECDTDEENDKLQGSLTSAMFPTPQQRASMMVPLDEGSPDADAPSPGDGRVQWIPAHANSRPANDAYEYE